MSDVSLLPPLLRKFDDVSNKVKSGRYFSRYYFFTKVDDVSFRKKYNRIYIKLISPKSQSFALWPEEEKELDDIKTGKAKMTTQSGEDFISEFNKMINE